MTNEKLTALRELLAAIERGDAPNYRHDDAFGGVNADSTHSIDAFNGSIDSAKVLHDAMLPEWVVLSIGQETGIWRVGIQGGDGGAGVWGANSDLARAWLIAVIKALIK